MPREAGFMMPGCVRFLCMPLVVFGFGFSQTVQITGRVLERAAMDPVPGATVYWKGSGLYAVTDTAGRFTLTGTPTALQPRIVDWSGPLMEHGSLNLRTLVPNIRVETKLFNTNGKAVASAVYNLESSGVHSLPVLKNAPSDFVGFLKVRLGDQTYHLKVFNRGGPVSMAEARFVSAPSVLAKQAAAGDSVQVFMTGLNTKAVAAPNNTGDLGDIIMEYPKRAMIGVGLTPPYGAKILFDGTHGSAYATTNYFPLWHEWWRFPVSGHPAKSPQPISFVLAHDPQYLNDTVNHVTLRMCCETTTGQWGYSDIQENEAHGSVQIHAEWIQMGRPSSNPDSVDIPDSTTQCNANSTQTIALNGGCWNNSGVYIQSRFEVQIQSNALPPATITGTADNHYMGSITNEITPSSNQNKKNGIWQSYDVTFRTAGWKTMTTNRTGVGDTNALITTWWNGVQTILNWKATGAAAGISNHSGENMNDTLYGLKLQDELGDVRYRNVWIKKLRIDSTGTNFYY